MVCVSGSMVSEMILATAWVMLRVFTCLFLFASLINALTSFFLFSDSVNNLHPLQRQNICKKLDIKHSTGGDYRALAAKFDMANDDIIAISQNPDPTDKVLQWVGRNPKNTITKLRKVLQAMRREDCVNIIDEDPPSGKCYFMIKRLYKSFERQTKIKPANFSLNSRRMLKLFSCLYMHLRGKVKVIG